MRRSSSLRRSPAAPGRPRCGRRPRRARPRPGRTRALPPPVRPGPRRLRLRRAGGAGRRPTGAARRGAAAVRRGRGRGQSTRSIVEPHRRVHGVRGEAEIRQRPGLVAAARRVAPRAHRHVARLGGVRGHRDDGRRTTRRAPRGARRPVAARPRGRAPRGPARIAPSAHGQPRWAATSAGRAPVAPASPRSPATTTSGATRRTAAETTRAVAERSSAPRSSSQIRIARSAPRPRAHARTPPDSGGPTVRATARPPSAIAHSRAARSARAVTTSRSPPRWPTAPPDAGSRRSRSTETSSP